MTTLKDYLRDVINEAIQADREAQSDGQYLSEQGVEDIIEEYISIILTRIIGHE